MFIEDCKYYDPEDIEIKTILKNVNFKGKKVLDIGAGIGRLSFPIAKHAKEVVALDSDKRFGEYFKKHKKKNINFVNKKAEDYLKEGRKFDVILLAWPTIDYKFVDLVKKAMNDDSVFIFISCDYKSDYETIPDKLGIGNRPDFDKDIKNKLKFIKKIPQKFKLIKKEKINTKYTYPDKKTAFRILKNGMKMWFDLNLNKKYKERLIKLIDGHNLNNKVIFGEIIWFYLLTKKEV